jgi:hypothetical protein
VVEPDSSRQNAEPGLIHKRVLAIVAATKKLRKGRTSQQGYKYWGIEDLVPQFREHLIQNGVYLVQDVASPPLRESRQSKGGSPLIFCVVQMRYRLYAEDGSWIEGGACGEAQDNIDKAEPKAETCAYKNFLKRLLQVETEAQSLDTDRGGEELGGHGSKPTPQGRQPAPKRTEAQFVSDDAKKVYAGIMGMLNDLAPEARVDWKARVDGDRADTEALRKDYAELSVIVAEVKSKKEDQK